MLSSTCSIHNCLTFFRRATLIAVPFKHKRNSTANDKQNMVEDNNDKEHFRKCEDVFLLIIERMDALGKLSRLFRKRLHKLNLHRKRSIPFTVIILKTFANWLSL